MPGESVGVGPFCRRKRAGKLFELSGLGRAGELTQSPGFGSQIVDQIRTVGAELFSPIAAAWLFSRRLFELR